MLEKCANIWVFLTVFCLCYFLETITFTYLISAIQSIEKQFQIPSSKSGALVSANDIGYVLTVVVLAYIGSKGNRARFIGGGCLLISFACLLISLPHFIFPHKELVTNGSMITNLMMPPAYLRADNVTPEQILNYPPFRKKIPSEAYEMLMAKLRGEEDESSPFSEFFDYLGEYEYEDDEVENALEVAAKKPLDLAPTEPLPDYEAEYYDTLDSEMSRSRRKRQMNKKPPKELISMFIEVKLGVRNVSSLFEYAKKMLKKKPPEVMVKRVQRAAGMPFGHCSPLINRIKGRIADYKCSFEQANDAAFGMVFVGIMLIGVGHSMPWSLGVPLIDDNIKKRSAPLYFAGIFFIRILGPVLGFLIGSACSRLYFTLKNPGIMPMDPRWIGAWWLGFLIICVALFVPSLLMFFFPSKGVPKIPDEKTSGQPDGQPAQTELKQKNGGKPAVNLVDVHKKKPGQKSSLVFEIKGFWKALVQVLKSKVYTGCLIGRLFDAFAFKGFFVFLPKYLESHFGLPQYKANMYLGEFFDYLGEYEYEDDEVENALEVAAKKPLDLAPTEPLPDYEAEYYDTLDSEMSRSRRKRQMNKKPPKELISMFIEVKLGVRNVSSLFEYAKKMLKKKPPEVMVKRVQRAAGMPFGHCSPLINRIKGRIADYKCSFEQANDAAFGMVFVGIMLIGVGHSMPWSLGVPLIDDNIKKRSAPLYFAGIFFIRILGPVLGFLIGSACSRLYFTLKNPGIMPMDPRWIGAWWLGFLIICVALFVPSLLMFFFPSKGVPKIPDEKTSGQPDGQPAQTELKQKNGGKPAVNLVDVHKKKPGQKSSLVFEIKGFWKALVQVLKSKVYTGCLIGRLFDAFAFKGFFVFLPKYLESHFGLPQYKANMYLGILGVFGFAAGVIVGSLVMKRFKLEGRKAAIWVGSCSLISSLLFFGKIGLGCHSVVNKVGQIGQQNGFNFTLPCNADCNCEPVSLFPVCDEAGNAFYSACTAGCKNMTRPGKDGGQKFMFTECQCVNSTLAPSMTVSRDNCHDDCNGPLIAYFSLSVVSGIIAGSSVIPGILIVLRSVPPEFRSVALGFSGFLISMLSTFPSPIVYGALIDGACLLWTNACGKRGACRIYDPQILRFKMHGFNAALRLVGLLFDLWVIYWAKGLKLMEEDTPTSNAENGQANQDLDQPQHKPSQIEEDVRAMQSQGPDLGSQLSL